MKNDDYSSSLTATMNSPDSFSTSRVLSSKKDELHTTMGPKLSQTLKMGTAEKPKSKDTPFSSLGVRMGTSAKEEKRLVAIKQENLSLHAQKNLQSLGTQAKQEQGEAQEQLHAYFSKDETHLVDKKEEQHIINTPSSNHTKGKHERGTAQQQPHPQLSQDESHNVDKKEEQQVIMKASSSNQVRNSLPKSPVKENLNVPTHSTTKPPVSLLRKNQTEDLQKNIRQTPHPILVPRVNKNDSKSNDKNNNDNNNIESSIHSNDSDNEQEIEAASETKINGRINASDKNKNGDKNYNNKSNNNQSNQKASSNRFIKPSPSKPPPLQSNSQKKQEQEQHLTTAPTSKISTPLNVPRTSNGTFMQFAADDSVPHPDNLSTPTNFSSPYPPLTSSELLAFQGSSEVSPLKTLLPSPQLSGSRKGPHHTQVMHSLNHPDVPHQLPNHSVDHIENSIPKPVTQFLGQKPHELLFQHLLSNSEAVGSSSLNNPNEPTAKGLSSLFNKDTLFSIARVWIKDKLKRYIISHIEKQNTRGNLAAPKDNQPDMDVLNFPSEGHINENNTETYPHDANKVSNHQGLNSPLYNSELSPRALEGSVSPILQAYFPSPDNRPIGDSGNLSPFLAEQTNSNLDELLPFDLNENDILHQYFNYGENAPDHHQGPNQSNSSLPHLQNQNGNKHQGIFPRVHGNEEHPPLNVYNNHCYDDKIHTQHVINLQQHYEHDPTEENEEHHANSYQMNNHSTAHMFQGMNDYSNINEGNSYNQSQSHTNSHSHRQSHVSDTSKKREFARSKFCHICGRAAKEGHGVSCANFDKITTRISCRKTVCRSCFELNNWDWEDAVNRVDWLCPHCQGVCPPRAQCASYNRINMKRKRE